MANLSKTELQKLVDSVSLQLTEVLEKAEEIPAQELAKATPGNEAPAEKNPAGSSTSEETPGEGSESESAPASEASDSAPPSDSPPAESAPPSDGSAAPPSDAPADPAQDGGGSVESLQAEYAALPLEELKMHLLACKAALMAQMVQGGGDGASPDASAGQAPIDGAGPGAAEGAAPAGAAPPPASPEGTPPAGAPPEGTPPMQKSETDTAILDRITALEKSVKEKDEVISGFGQIASKLETIFTKRKSAHSIAALSKPGTEMAKSEDSIDVTSLKSEQVIEKLNAAIAGGKLSKSDKDAIISYTVSPMKDISKVAHLLGKK